MYCYLCLSWPEKWFLGSHTCILSGQSIDAPTLETRNSKLLTAKRRNCLAFISRICLSAIWIHTYMNGCCANVKTRLCQRADGIEWTDGRTDGWMDGQGRQMQWNVPYQHAHKSNISNKHFCRWLRIIIIKNASYMDMHIRNVCGPRRRICTTHAHTLTHTHTLLNRILMHAYTATYTYIRIHIGNCGKLISNQIKFCTVRFIFCICV